MRAAEPNDRLTRLEEKADPATRGHRRFRLEAGVPIERRPVLPWHVELGASIHDDAGLELGLRLRLTTDENEPTNVLRAIDGVGIGASIRYRIP